MRLFAAMLLLVPAAWSAKLTVCASGCDGTTLESQCTAAAAGDSIEVKNGPAAYTLASNCDLTSKARVTVYTSSSPRDTLYRVNGAGTRSVIVGGDTTTLDGFYVAWTTDTSATTFNYLYSTSQATAKSGAIIKNCYFKLNGQATGVTYKRGIQMYSPAAKSRLNTFEDCYFDSVFVNPHTDVNLPTRTTYTRCVFQGTYVQMGDSSKVKNCIARVSTLSGPKEPIRLMGNRDTVDGLYLNGANVASGGEVITSDYLPNTTREGMYIANIVIDSLTHVGFAGDGFLNSTVTNWSFLYRDSVNAAGKPGAGISFMSGHSSQLYDTISNTRFQYLTFTGGRGTNSYAMQWPAPTGNGTGSGVKYARMLMKGADGGQMLSRNISNDALDSVVAQSTNASAPWDSITTVGPDTIRSTTIALITPDASLYAQNQAVWTFLKYRSSAAIRSSTIHWGDRRHLLNPGAAFSITSSGFSVPCSTAANFWWRNPTGRSTIAGAAVGRDTILTIKLQTSTDGSAWTDRATATNAVAGDLDTLAATGLSAGTKYYWRLVGAGNAESGSVTDTTLYTSGQAFSDSTTTSAAGGVPRGTLMLMGVGK